MRKHAATLCALAALTLFASGCVDLTTRVMVRPDGSGRITETCYISSPVAHAADSLSRTLAQVRGGSETNAPPTDEEVYKRRAAAMGTGVALVSLREVTREDATTGVRATYAFADIEDLRLLLRPPFPLPPECLISEAGTDALPSGYSVRFSYESGTPNRLVVRLPGFAGRAPTEAGTAETADETPTDRASLLREMFAGFRLRLILDVAGEVLQTDASFFQPETELDRRRQVVLLDLAADRLLIDERSGSLLERLVETRDLAEACHLLRRVPGMPIEPRETVEVVFE